MYPGMHDFARNAQHNKRNQKSKQSKPPASKLLILFTLMVLTGLVFGLYKLTSVKPQSVVAKPSAASSKKTAPAPQKISKPAKEEYDFYSMLPESEVIAPKVEEYSSKKADTAAQQYAYLLQAGSFRSAAEADKLRAKLLLEGLNAQTSKITNQNGSIWYRVMVGPFTSRSKLNSAQDVLANANTESLVIKVKR
jgi:cell division protein FtsN